MSSEATTTGQEKVCVALFFGGRSGEHEISLLSARGVLEALDPQRFKVVPVGITLEGEWLIGEGALEALEARAAGTPPPEHPTPLPAAKVVGDLLSSGEPSAESARLRQVDVAFPLLHGPFGEDGTIQGLFEMVGWPYVGCGVAASAVAMDKALSKALFRAAGLPVVPHVVLLRQEWEVRPDEVVARVEAALPYPVFVKPANLGSSVGVSRAEGREELAKALDLAAQFDRKLIVERGIVPARELEVAVLGNDRPRASVPGEVRPRGHTFYNYEAKYTEGGSELLIPAPLPASLQHTLRELAVAAFRALDGSGMARVDFLMDPQTDALYVNEINTIPGFTPYSMYPKLWIAEGLSYSQLVEELVRLALERAADRARNRVTR